METLPRALIVFAKLPKPGQVKTRLTTLLSPEESASLYEAFLKDALECYLTLDVDIRLYFGPADKEVPEDLQPEGITVHWQKGDGLGARMAAAFAETFVAGYQQAVIIGTDHPTLPQAFLELAFQSLEEPKSITIGPSDDGGYYLLGMNSFYPQVFQDMTYSHGEVFAQTLEKAGDTGAGVHILPEWYDVDDPETLKRLAQDLTDSNLPLPRTRKGDAAVEANLPATPLKKGKATLKKSKAKIGYMCVNTEALPGAGD